ncbi:MAG TPA: alanine dehydrogenase [Xanthobacteraceae bacterium]|nr:alanine dehydrogenase [Xanthobacteraceae bacterium]
MRIGVPKEIKDNEFRVGLVPASVAELIRRGHQVAVQTRAGEGAGIADADYVEAGAEVAASAGEVFARADMIVKVKEPLAVERSMLRAGQIIFTYLHLAADRAQTEELIAAGANAIAYETVTDAQGQLPLLRPMSEVAGRMAAQVGAQFLERPHGGRGILLGGVPGVAPAQVVVIGAGVVGTNAALIAAGMGADVTVTAPSPDALRRVAERFGARVPTVTSTREAIEGLCRNADLVIAAALVPGAAAPKLISAATVKAMRAGSVIVDVSIDQGGSAETSRPTTHSQPTFVVEGVVHYCVTNMPGAVPRTSTFALNNATRPFVLALADKGWRRALIEDAHLRNGLNVSQGRLTCRAVAEALQLPFTPADQVVHA